MNDIEKTQHFSKNWEKLLYNINFKPANAVDPFAGNCDLVDYSPETSWELYDIDPKKENVQIRDSLLNPINYTGKTVITNPPYLSKSKTNDFSKIFDKYKVDDLYKASILSIIGCKNGILIIPLNFFTDKKTKSVREKFLSQYKVSYVNYFTKQVFENTTYNVCAFYFEEGETSDVIFHDYFADKDVKINLCKKYGYRVGGDFFSSYDNVHQEFSRVLKGDTPDTNIFVNCLDSRTRPFYLEYKPGYVHFAKQTDRIFATLKCHRDLTPEQQKEIVKRFNTLIEEARANYGNLLFTNYRDNGRKKIALEDVYKICSKIAKDLNIF